MRRLRLAGLAGLAACTALDVPPAETPYFREQTALASAAPSAPLGREATVLRDASAQLVTRAAGEVERIRRNEETDGLLHVSTADARDFLAVLADPARAESLLADTSLDLDHVLLAAYARNPEIAAARGNWSAAVRMYDQATWLEDILLRHRAFTSRATMPVGGGPMPAPAFPYPGTIALKGEMIDAEVAMAREMLRMRVRDVLVAAANAYHTAVHQEREVALRDEQVSLARRMASSSKSRVESGRGPQAELLEMEAEVAMAENEKAYAVTSLARARADLDTILARDPAAPISLMHHDQTDPPPDSLPLEPLLVLARRFAPEIRIARAELVRTDAALRMSEVMLATAPAPASVAAVPMSDGAMPGRSSLPPRDDVPPPLPGLLGTDLAWVAEMKERRGALEHLLDESVRATERRVLEAHWELEAQRRMFSVAAKSTEPLAAQALDERTRLYESGRGEFAGLVAASKRHLDAAHDVLEARHEYFVAESALWAAIGARPGLATAPTHEGHPR